MPALVDGIQSHWTNLREDAGVDVTYSHQGAAGVALGAVKGRRQTELATTEYVETSIADDFLFLWADLVAAGISEPMIGDVIEWTDENSIARKFEVGLPGGERQWDPADQYHIIVRVHCQEFKP